MAETTATCSAGNWHEMKSPSDWDEFKEEQGIKEFAPVF
jgi:hypothetical protein